MGSCLSLLPSFQQVGNINKKNQGYQSVAYDTHDLFTYMIVTEKELWRMSTEQNINNTKSKNLQIFSCSKSPREDDCVKIGGFKTGQRFNIAPGNSGRLHKNISVTDRFRAFTNLNDH